MKTINKILSVAVLGALMTGCNDLDTLPQGQYITSSQKGQAVEANPELALAGVTGITANFSVHNKVYVVESHNDFGYPAVMLGLDQRGIDMVGLNAGYNWFESCCAMDDGDGNGFITAEVWSTLYRQINTANETIAKIAADTDNETLKFYRAQALAIRAFDYFQLAQLYQRTYVGNESKPCVPVITDENSVEAGNNGVARSTVQEVYERITADLDEAVKLLTNNPVKRESELASGVKRFVDEATVHGLRARVYLVMNKWNDAANEAQAALNTTSAQPFSIAEASVPAFSSMSDNNWMWGIYIDEQDRVVTSGIVNFPSHMGSMNYGYATVGAWRMVNKQLYNSISDTDARKGWFLDGNGESKNLTAAQQNYVTTMGAPAYTQVKFAPYQGVLDQDVNASDLPLMRVEEMYLILAEAQAMGGAATTGAKTLQDFVQQYRDPSYTCTATEPAAVQTAVWNQRRIEFWGEGISYFDLMRLNKGIDRRGGGWEPEYVYNIPAGDNIMVLCIPQSETNRNPLITPAQNNETSPRPTSVDDIQ